MAAWECDFRWVAKNFYGKRFDPWSPGSKCDLRWTGDVPQLAVFQVFESGVAIGRRGMVNKNEYEGWYL